MNTQDLKDKTVNGLFWSFSQKITSQLISFFITVILARILTPDDYGIVALAGLFLVLMSVFSDGGLGQALIQKKDADEKDFNTLFTTQLVFASFIYCIVFLIAPIVAESFNTKDPILFTSLLRVMALTMPLGALAGVQNSVVTRRLMFKWYFYANISSLVVSASVGIYMAYSGYGAWALVGQSMSSTITSTIVIFYLLDWHPKLLFYKERFKPLFREGVKFMGTSVVGTFFSQLISYILGLKYSPADLAYYNRGGGIPNLVSKNIDGTIQGVLFPVLAQIQDDIPAVRRVLSRAIRTSTFILFPMLFGVAAIADKLVIIVFTEKWAPCIPFMQVICVCNVIAVMAAVNLQALRATGHIGTVFKLEWLKKPLLVLVLAGTMMISPMAIIYGMLCMNIYSYMVNSYPNKKILNYSYKDQLKDIAPNIIVSAIMAFIVYLIGRINMNMYVSVVIQILFGAVFYIEVSYLRKDESLFYIYNYIKERLRKKHGIITTSGE